jgi:hypothetical protein
MRPWVAEPNLAPGEEVAWRRNANREQSALRQVGGRLFLTDRRIIFMPNRFDDAHGGRSWTCALSAIARVAVEPSRRNFPLFANVAPWRRRLRIEGHDGTVELFVVNKVDETVRTLQAVIPRPS